MYKPGNMTYNFQQWQLGSVMEPWTVPDDKSTNQLRWDSFLAVPGTAKLFGNSLTINAAGNHEARCQDTLLNL